MSGVFLTIEGVDGTGKTTHVEFIQHWFKSKGFSVIQTREPGGTAIGDKIRQIMLNRQYDFMDQTTELLLIFAARMQHIHEKIVPALSSGKIVLCDRFIDSTYAYQGGGRGINWGKITHLENLVQEGFQPDLTILLDLPVKTGVYRIEQRNGLMDRFDQQSLSFMEKVRQAYVVRATQFPDRIKVIDGSTDVDTVRQNIFLEIKKFFQRRNV